MTRYVFKTFSAGIFTSLLEIDIIIYRTDGNTKIVLSAVVGLIIDTLRRGQLYFTLCCLYSVILSISHQG